MAIRKRVSLFAGLGALLVSGALSALPSIYPNQFARHPKIVWGFLIAGLVLFLMEGLARVSQRTEKPEPVPAVSQARAEAIGNKVDLHIHPTPAPPAPQPPVSARSLLPRPQFDIRLTEGRVVVEGTVVRFLEPDKEGGEKCLALHVLNRAAKQGEQARKARCVFATMEFASGSRTTPVNRACWIDKDSNQIAIDVSQSEYILVGLVTGGDEWVTYNNPNKVNLRMREWYDPFEELQKRALNWGDGASYTVDVKIISNDPGPTLGETLAHRRFALERKGATYSAHMLTPE